MNKQNDIKNMKKNHRRFQCYVLISILSLCEISLANSAPLPVPAPPQVSARNYLLMDFDSQRVLAEKKADVKIEPASITKLMTAYVVYHELESGRLSMDDIVTISK